MRRPSSEKLTIPPISSAAPAALYQQVIDGIKREIAEGRLRPGAALPSFRALAEDLLVSVITVKRAYEELEREGIIYRKQGLGTFVADRGDAITREAKRHEANDQLGAALQLCLDAGMNDVEIIDAVSGHLHKSGFVML